MQLLRWLLALLILAQPCFGPGVLAAVIGRSQVKAVVVNQVVSGTASTLRSKITIDVGRIEVIRGQLAQTKGTNRAPNATSSRFPGVEPQDFGTDLTEKEIREIADAIVESSKSAITAALLEQMNANAATTGFYTFDQVVRLKDDSNLHRLVWTLVVDSTGRSIAGNTKIVKSSLSYIYLTYTPRQVAQGLPQSWQYPDAGILTWMLVDAKMRRIGPVNTIDTGGFFDEGEEPSPDEPQLRCLIDKAKAGCSSPFVDAVTLIQQHSADGAFVDYVHRLSPVYDNIETPPGSGTFEAKAHVTFNINVRNVSQTLDAQCKNPSYFYRNSGQFQFLLNQSMTRYFVVPDGTGRYPVGQLQTSVNSPIEGYDLTLPVDEGSLGALGNYFVDPFNQGEPLINVGLLSSSSTVAPYVIEPPPKCIPVPLPTTPAATTSTAP